MDFCLSPVGERFFHKAAKFLSPVSEGDGYD
jgi:hypothetical protein